MGGGASHDNFSISGPYHLTSIDWTNSQHRTSVASSLVNGVYVLENDRLGKREGSESLAKPWWDSFDFDLTKTMIDKDDSIYGAVFEYKHYSLYQNTPHVEVPHYVIAFRGTVLKEKTWKSDLKNGLLSIVNSLYRGGRSKDAVKEIRSMVEKHNETGIWLAGHSLGAALVLLAGKTMARSGVHLESYIFNPPISSIPLEQLPWGDKLKDVFQIATNLVKATAVKALTDRQVQEEDPKAASWIPFLFVNPADPICAGYINYFKLKTLMSAIGASKIERIGTRTSLRSLFVRRIGKSSPSDLSTEPLHLLPSADLAINKNKPTKFTTAHGLHQWWERNPALRANWESCCIRPTLREKMK